MERSRGKEKKRVEGDNIYWALELETGRWRRKNMLAVTE